MNETETERFEAYAAGLLAIDPEEAMRFEAWKAEREGTAIPCCGRCADVYSEGSPADFECLECDETLCRLCAEEHAREAHPMPYEASVASQVDAERRTHGRLALAMSLGGGMAVAVILWPEQERIFALTLEPRFQAVAAILVAASLTNRFLVGRIARWIVARREGS